ncbi:chromosomal replication initiator protein DnaA [Candidatus Azambacteria bacterium]|nr:chromosomal replication initiator protein DnaA [Candidatus Azambacteria bacterium]MBI3685338.1 chromosomal replication initiator protein DnaA [Candidatus Azambacteria bacterium]
MNEATNEVVMENEGLWRHVLSEVELSVSHASFNTWFQHTHIYSKTEGIIVVSVPNSFAKEWLESKFNKFILKSLRGASPDIKDVQFIISPAGSAIPFKFKKKKEEREVVPQDSQFEFQGADKDTNLNHKYTFDDFVVGSSNELAHAAAVSITKNIGTVYNPLFIYGGVGLGKTHLLQAIGNEVLKLHKGKLVKYVSSEKFTSELVAAIQNREMEKFKEEYRKHDVLIIDDVQFLAGKDKTQEEFFHTFNALYEKNKQIILSSDRPPKAIPTLEDRLRSRFEGGMIADIGYPDYEMRLAILKNKVVKKEASLQDEVLEYISHNFQKNIRELEGALNKVIIQMKISKNPLILDDVKRILSPSLATPKKAANIKQIIQSVAGFYGINEKQLIIKTRKQEVVRPRQVIMYLLREEFKFSYPSIGSKIGGRDHTTVMHACEKIGGLLKNDESFAEEIGMIKKLIYSV